MCAANFMADLVNLVLLVNFSMVLGAFLGQIVRDAKSRSHEAKAASLTA